MTKRETKREIDRETYEKLQQLTEQHMAAVTINATGRTATELHELYSSTFKLLLGVYNAGHDNGAVYGWQRCVQAVRASLEDYPEQGGDIVIMAHVGRLIKEHGGTPPER